MDLDTANRPLVLIWELTQACGLACDHCRADARPGRHPDELSTEEGKALLEDTAGFGDGQLVVLSGGDPLVRDDVEELVAYGTDLGLRMTITPSGTRSVTADRLDRLADAGLARMAISLDGATPAAHDAFRGERGSFDETIRAARDARDAGIPVQVNTTVCRETLGQLPAIRALVREMGAVMWSVFFLVPIGRGRLLESIDPAEADAVMAWLDDVSEREPFGLKTTEAPQYRRVVAQRASRTTRSENRTNVERRTGIVAGDGFAFVGHTGDVFPSGFLPSSAGSVRDRSITELYRRSPLFRSLRNRDRLEGKCGVCPYRQLCGGSRSRAFARTGNPHASDPLCPYVPDGYEGPLPWSDRRVGTDGTVADD
ncbi:TIGR04053 family radical SAM/SPASM domain-containing protein [Natrarchaeobius oligotrophus]|uniref:TIGR04053 family radical SAM/SPASM domain-containing protein n=1 Tax=Natrarchaeobius chitinivorans TaxID=1679083 RepID=A0A3N6M9H4_NATCH|nr:TIGR04053 family radical SAM/SPASM domain-containing protein [Natrarchaeobius chitinivorans]RQH00414.1 TIGR04053 family radical SAM/SPASM domain-containing protein [Natrarchaeobius chitinivorans]